MLLQKFPKTVSYTVIMAVIPKINENSASGGGGMRSVRYPMKSEVQGGLYPDDGDKGRLLFSYRIALEQYLKKVLFYNLTIISRAAALRCHIAKERG